MLRMEWLLKRRIRENPWSRMDRDKGMSRLRIVAQFVDQARTVASTGDLRRWLERASTEIGFRRFLPWSTTSICVAILPLPDYRSAFLLIPEG